MAIDVTLDNILAGFNLSKLNDNFTRIDTALQDGLSRSGTGPNQMLADFDLNSNDILNGGAANFTSITVNGEEIFDLTQAALDAAQVAQAASEAAQVAAEAAQVAAEAAASGAATAETGAQTAETGAEAAQAAAEAAAAEAIAGVKPIVSIDETDILGAGPGGYILEESTVYLVNPHGTSVTIKLPSDAENNQEFFVYLMDTDVAPGDITIEGGGNDIAQDSADFLLDINYTGDRFKLDLPNTNYITTFINILGE